MVWIFQVVYIFVYHSSALFVLGLDALADVFVRVAKAERDPVAAFVWVRVAVLLYHMMILAARGVIYMRNTLHPLILGDADIALSE